MASQTDERALESPSGRQEKRPRGLHWQVTPSSPLVRNSTIFFLPILLNCLVPVVLASDLASWLSISAAWNDAVEEACQNGIGIIAQPGGSIRDEDAVACCNKYGVSLVFTGVRHFRH